MGKALVQTDRNTDLEAWGDRQALREMADRIKIMLPYGKDLTPDEALALAQASSLTGLNPFEGENYFLKNPKTGESRGVYTGIKGRRRKAREQLYRQIGKGANFWIEYEFASAEWKAANNYDAQATVCIATLRDTGTINEYVRIVTALVAAHMSASDIKAIAGDRPFVVGVGFVKPGECLIRPLREVAKKRAERAALAQRFDIGLKIKSDDQVDDASDDSMSDLDTDGQDWGEAIESGHIPASLEHNKMQLGRDDGNLTGAFTPATPAGPTMQTEPVTDSRTGYVIGESNGVGARIYDDAKFTAVPTLSPLDLPPTAQVERPAPPKSAPKTTGATVKMASIKFVSQTVAEWKATAAAFADANPNWRMKSGQPDMAHIQASAGHCGFAYIDGDNWPEVEHMIVAAHKAKAADAEVLTPEP